MSICPGYTFAKGAEEASVPSSQEELELNFARAPRCRLLLGVDERVPCCVLLANRQRRQWNLDLAKAVICGQEALVEGHKLAR